MFILSEIIERFKRRRRLIEESRELHGFAMAIVSREQGSSQKTENKAR